MKLGEEDLPFVLNCFTSQAGTTNIINFTCEFNVSCEKIKQIALLEFLVKVSGKTTHSAVNSESKLTSDGLKWSISNLSEDIQTSLDVKTPDDPASLFPIAISMSLGRSFIKANAKAFDENKQELILLFSEKCETSDFKVVYD